MCILFCFYVTRISNISISTNSIMFDLIGFTFCHVIFNIVTFLAKRLTLIALSHHRILCFVAHCTGQSLPSLIRTRDEQSSPAALPLLIPFSAVFISFVFTPSSTVYLGTVLGEHGEMEGEIREGVRGWCVIESLARVMRLRNVSMKGMFPKRTRHNKLWVDK